MQRAIAVFFLVLFVYLGTYSGSYHSLDEVGLATMAINIVRDGTPHVDGLRWAASSDGSLPATLAARYTNGHLYFTFEPAQSYLAVPLIWLANRLPAAIDVYRTLLLFNAFMAAGLAALFYLVARRSGIRVPASIAAALLLGLATPLWPYARQFFREPLGGFGLLLLCLSLLCLRLKQRAAWACLAGFGLGLAQAARTTHLVVLPAALVYLALSVAPAPLPGVRTAVAQWIAFLRCSPTARVELLRRAVAFLAGLLPIELFTFWTNLDRFGSPTYSYYTWDTYFHGSLLTGLYGLILSPGKGILLFAPALLPVLRFWRSWARSYPYEAIFWLLALIPSLLLLGLYRDWWGGLDWGPRYLVPYLPLLLLPLPFCLQQLGKAGSPTRLLAMLLCLGGVIVQLPAVLSNYATYPSESLRQTGTQPETGLWLWNLPASPILAGWRYVTAAQSDLIWWQPGRLDPALPLVALAGVCGMAAFLYRSCRQPMHKRPVSQKRAVPEGIFGLVVPLSPAMFRLNGIVLPAGILCLAVLLGTLAWTITLQPPAAGIEEATAAIAQHVLPGDTLISLAGPESLAAGNLALSGNLYRTGAALYGIGLQGPSPQDRHDLDARLQAGSTAWVLSQGIGSTAAQNGAETWLAGEAYRTNQEYWWSGLRLIRYLPPVPGAVQAVVPAADFMNGLHLLEVQVPAAELQPGGWLRVRTTWQASRPQTKPLIIFVHLVDQAQRSWAGMDGEPAGGYRPVTGWLPGAPVVDQRAFPLPAELPPGAYHIEAGLMNVGDAVRIPLAERGTDAVTAATLLVHQPAGTMPVSPDEYARQLALPLIWQDGPQLLSYRINGQAIAMSWTTNKPLARDLTLFVQLLDPGGHVVAQVDQRPQGDRYPTNLWLPGEVINDSAGLPVPAALPPGSYSLIAGWYTQPGLQRLQVADTQGKLLGDAVTLGSLEIKR